jgi:uncharacterized protein YodC (DUF2158 family)
MEQIKHGVVVRLKSGGPKMTVSACNSKFPLGLVCHWFIGDELRTGDFSREELEIAELQKESPETLED